MSKRGPGEGTIYRRKDGRWEASIRVDGVRHSSYSRIRVEAAAWLKQALRLLDEGLPIASSKDTMAKFLTDWLETMSQTIRPRTLDRYEQFVRLHIVPEIGRIQLAKLAPTHLQAMYAARGKAGLSPRTVHHLHAFLHRVLADAVAWGLVSRNVSDFARPPRVPAVKMAALAPEQAKQLLQAAKDNRLESLYVLAISTGMRQGELLGLRWADIDLGNEVLRVSGTLARTRTEGLRVDEPKTKGSRREIAIGPPEVSALRRHHRRQAAERLAAGPNWQSNDFVFSTSTGVPIEASNLIRRSFVPLLAQAKLPKMRFNDLRHTAASLMLAQGIPAKVVAERLGHSNIGITLDTYAHALPNMQREAARIMDELLFPNGPRR